MAHASAYAELVELDVDGHVALADYDRSDDPVAPLVILGHGTLAHKDMETIDLLHEAFVERGYSVLSYSLTYDQDRRTGMYDCAREVHDITQQDAVTQIAAWVRWARELGHEKIALLGIVEVAIRSCVMPKMMVIYQGSSFWRLPTKIPL